MSSITGHRIFALFLFYDIIVPDETFIMTILILRVLVRSVTCGVDFIAFSGTAFFIAHIVCIFGNGDKTDSSSGFVRALLVDWASFGHMAKIEALFEAISSFANSELTRLFWNYSQSPYLATSQILGRGP